MDNKIKKFIKTIQQNASSNFTTLRLLDLHESVPNTERTKAPKQTRTEIRQDNLTIYKKGNMLTVITVVS